MFDQTRKRNRWLEAQKIQFFCIHQMIIIIVREAGKMFDCRSLSLSFRFQDDRSVSMMMSLRTYTRAELLSHVCLSVCLSVYQSALKSCTSSFLHSLIIDLVRQTDRQINKANTNSLNAIRLCYMYVRMCCWLVDVAAAASEREHCFSLSLDRRSLQLATLLLGPLLIRPSDSQSVSPSNRQTDIHS